MGTSFKFKNNVYLDWGSIYDSPIKKVNVTTEVSSGKVIFTLEGNYNLLDTIIWITYHSNTNNFGGSILLNAAYGANVVHSNSHNSSGYSISLSGYVNTGIKITINENNIAATDTFRVYANRTKSYREY